jgi:monooxygenase
VQPSHFDVLIVGAGLSGVGAAYHLQTLCPGKTYVILEGRETLGGTWDLFRYPGIRSDSDMYTLGYSFRPWTNAKAIADGASILAYVKDTAEANGIDEKIRYGHRVEKASWSSDAATWTVESRDTKSGELVRLTCNFLFMCAGYYDYEGGYSPEFAGMEKFRGRVVHPQKWTSDVEYEGKKVVVIGSGTSSRLPRRTRLPTGCVSASRPSRRTRSRGGRTCFSAWRSTITAAVSLRRRKSFSSSK